MATNDKLKARIAELKASFNNGRDIISNARSTFSNLKRQAADIKAKTLLAGKSISEADYSKFKSTQSRLVEASKKLGYLETVLKGAENSTAKTNKRIISLQGDKLNATAVAAGESNISTATGKADAANAQLQNAQTKIAEASTILNGDISDATITQLETLAEEVNTSIDLATANLSGATEKQADGDANSYACGAYIYLPAECLIVNDKIIDGVFGNLIASGIEGFYQLESVADKVICIVYVENPDDDEAAWVYAVTWVYSDAELEQFRAENQNAYKHSFTVARFAGSSNLSITQIAHGLENVGGSGGGASMGIMPWRLSITRNADSSSSVWSATLHDLYYQIGGETRILGDTYDASQVNGVICMRIRIAPNGQPTIGVDTTSFDDIASLMSYQANNIDEYIIPVYQMKLDADNDNKPTIVHDFRGMPNFAMIDTYGTWIKNY